MDAGQTGRRVGGLPFDDPSNGTDAPWDFRPLQRMKRRYEEAGFTLAVIEARPPLNKAKRGLPGRDEEIAAVCTLLENMGRLGIPVWCYQWMADFDWLRTDHNTPSRGDSLVTSFDKSLLGYAHRTDGVGDGDGQEQSRRDYAGDDSRVFNSLG